MEISTWGDDVKSRDLLKHVEIYIAIKKTRFSATSLHNEEYMNSINGKGPREDREVEEAEN